MEEDEIFESEILHTTFEGNNGTDSKCYVWDPEDYIFLQNYEFWIKAALDLPLSFIGIIVNTFCLTVLLSKQRLRNILFNQVSISLFF